MSTSLNELIDQLRAQPLVELTGVVGAGGGGGVKSQADKLWSFTFTLVAWRRNGEAINDSELVVRRLAKDVELEALERQIDANTVVRLKARVAMDSVYDRPEALLESIEGETRADAELNAHLVEILKPVVRTDEEFGDFHFDRSVSTFTADTEWLGNSIELDLSLDEIEDFDSALKVARSLWSGAAKWNSLVLDCLARDLLPLKNENWQEEDGSTVSREQFESRITLQSITVQADGDIEFWYDDDDLFWGHAIAVMGSLEAGDLSGGIHG